MKVKSGNIEKTSDVEKVLISNRKKIMEEIGAFGFEKTEAES